MTLTFDQVQTFCGARPIELAFAPTAVPVGALVLHADFEGHGDFFTIEVDGIEYVDMVGRLWVGGMEFREWRQVAALKTKWKPIASRYSGSALVLWDDDAHSLEAAPEAECHVIVAGRFTFRAGQSWAATR